MICFKCKKEIPVGEVFKRTPDGCICERCLGIKNPYDNPEEYKYFWNGNIVSLNELPDYARKFFPTLDMYK
jgi:hypothetical protein